MCVAFRDTCTCMGRTIMLVDITMKSFTSKRCDHFNETPVHALVFNEHKDVLNELIQSVTDVNDFDDVSDDVKDDMPKQ